MKDFSYLNNVVINEDVTNVFQHIPKESVDLTVTSPPYFNAREYSSFETYESYLSFLDDTFFDVHEITKEGGFLIVNTSPVIEPRLSRSHQSKRYGIPFDLHSILTKSDWDFIDDIVWVKPEASVKNRNAGFAQHRNPLAYKPNCITEYVMVYRKKTDRLIDWNIHSYSENTLNESKVQDGFETTNVWNIQPVGDRIHPAVFPAELCKRIIEYYSMKGDLVFDPFGGSGTVARVARKMDRNFLLVEKDKKYFDYIRMQDFGGQLFSDVTTKFLNLEQFIQLRHD